MKNVQSSLNKSLKLCLGIVAGLLLAGLGVIGPGEQALAYSGSDFPAGNIISDAVFTNYYAMSVTDIQNFLQSKTANGSCDTNGTQSYSYYFNSSTGEVHSYAFSGGSYTTSSRNIFGQHYDKWYSTNIGATPYVCLPQYIENPSTGQNNLQNPGATIAGGQSAAQIIYNAAQHYQINPEVLIVTLQKEQGLVTDDWPWINEYQEAMGYMCPDTPQGCNSSYAGFYKQVNDAAWQFRYYLDNPGAFNYWIGNNYIQYSTDSSCGGSTVNIQNASTAALYIYTPYQPDAAVLSATNPTGSSWPGTASGDNCATYGNRNFWWYFTSWFGSTQTTIPYAWTLNSAASYIDSNDTVPFSMANHRINVAPGGTAYMVVKARNNGYKTWTPDVVRLGTTNPIGRCSPFYDTATWINCGRIAMQEQSVAPGDSATFNYALKAPTTLGSYQECMNVVADGVTWMNDPRLCYWIDVVNPQPANANLKNTLLSGQSLGDGQYLMDQAAHSVLAVQHDGNLVLTSDFQQRWSSATSGNTGDQLLMQPDGNLVLYTKDMKAIWNSGTVGNSGAYAILQNDGNLVVYSSSNTPLWSSGTNDTQSHLNYVNHSASATFLYPMQSLQMADGKYKMLFQPDGNLVLYASTRAIWSTQTNGTAATIMAMQPDGNLVLYTKDMKAIWNSGTVGQGVSHLDMQDDGNLVIYNAAGHATWNTGTNGKQ